MPTVLKLRRGNTTSSNAFTGAEGEVTLDTTKKTVVVHDGINAGGTPLATEAALASGLAGKANTSSLATVATSGSYTDLSNKPTLFSGSYTDLTDKPTIPFNTDQLMNGAGYVTSSVVNGYATESYVTSAVSTLIGAAPAALDTLNELAAALNNDASFASTITTSLASKANTSSLSAVATSGSYTDLSNKPTIPTNTNQLTNGAGFITSSDISGKQNTLVSGTSIKTINSTTLLGSGNIAVQATLVSGTNIKTVGSTSLLGSGDISFKTVNGNSLLGSGDITISGGGTDYSTAYEIKIGQNAGSNSQGYNTVAVGYNAGAAYQGNYAVALGSDAGGYGQGASAIGIGRYAGSNGQMPFAIRIGSDSGSNGHYQGLHSIAIGTNAVQSNQSDNSIVLNAGGESSAINANNSGFFVNPIRSAAAGSQCLYYNPTTKEITYGPTPVASDGGGGSTGFSQPLQFLDFDPAGPGTVTLIFTNSSAATDFLAAVGTNTVTVTGLQSGPSTLTIAGGNWTSQSPIVVRLTAPMLNPDLYAQSGGQLLSFNGGTASFTSSSGSGGGGGTTTYGYNSGGVLSENYNSGTGYTEFTLSSTDAALFAADYTNLKNTITNLVSSASMTGVNAYSNSMAILVTDTTYYPITQTQQVTSGAGQVVFSNMNATYGMPISNLPNFTLGAGLYINHNFSLMLGGSSISYSYNAGTCTVSSGSGFSSNDYAGALNQAVSAYAAIARISGAAMTLGGTSLTDGFSGGMITFAGVSNFVTSGQDLQFSYQTVIEPFTNGGPSALLSLTPRKQ